MKKKRQKFAQLSIWVFLIFFTIKVSGQAQCKLTTNDPEIFENCINNLRKDYNVMIISKVNFSNKHKLSRNEIYSKLLKDYKKLINYYDQTSTLDTDKIDEFEEKLNSLKKTKN